jgi:hypothetical protein
MGDMPGAGSHHRRVIRNACIHINGEQPLLADLFELPATSDLALRCTNLRAMNGKRPVFADDSASVFYFPYLHIRFIEIPPSSMAEGDLDMPVDIGTAFRLSDGQAAGEPELDAELEIDEDFLRRVREA